MKDTDFRNQVNAGERFRFGDNWKNFLQSLNDKRIAQAMSSLQEKLDSESLDHQKFLDIGSGSGLFSLAARNLGAKVTSIDFDLSSAWCTSALKEKYHNADPDWLIEEGSALDENYFETLGKFDIVYSWGVLHHAGEMWKAIHNSTKRVTDGGPLFIAIYNDQGLVSHLWWIVKYVYSALPKILKKPYAYSLGLFVQFLMLVKYTLKLQPMNILWPMLNYEKNRGMRYPSDIIDWYGGFPFEFAKHNTIVRFLDGIGYTYLRGKEDTSLGCYELVFRKNEASL